MPVNSRIDWQPHIIEFYGVIYDENQNLVKELEFLCNPPVPISAKISQITHIFPKDVVDKPSFSHYAESVKDLIEESDVEVAHNLGYDFNVVDYEMQRLGMKVNHGKKFCTLEQTRFLEGRRFSLSNLYSYCFEEKFKDAHRARNDVEALVKVFFHLKGKIW